MYSLLLSGVNETWILWTDVRKRLKICPVGAELFQADRRMDRHDEALQNGPSGFKIWACGRRVSWIWKQYASPKQRCLYSVAYVIRREKTWMLNFCTQRLLMLKFSALSRLVRTICKRINLTLLRDLRVLPHCGWGRRCSGVVVVVYRRLGTTYRSHLQA